MECTFIEDAPEAERIWEGVTAIEKMSVMWAGEVSGVSRWVAWSLPSSTVCVVRYCFDCNLLESFKWNEWIE